MNLYNSIIRNLTNIEIDALSLKHKAEQEANCRATLFVNFVAKSTCDIQIAHEIAERMSTYQLMCEVLLELIKKPK